MTLKKIEDAGSDETIYLDWNIFNKLENIDNLPDEQKDSYAKLAAFISKSSVSCPYSYSNAHMNDLYRGYVKDPTYAKGHIENITAVTRNLCITQYWGEKQVRWHHREASHYLDATIMAKDQEFSTLDSILNSDDYPELQVGFDFTKSVLQIIPIDKSFLQIYTKEPIFNSIYPRTKTELNMYALMEDILEFTFKMQNDFVLYKQFKRLINETRSRFPKHTPLHKNADSIAGQHPEYLDWDQSWEDASTKYPQKSSNLAYDRIINLFVTTDLKGYRQDDKFANLLDDALHCFYAAHCDYFITIDSKCADKAKLVYGKLGITTKVYNPLAFSIVLDGNNIK